MLKGPSAATLYGQDAANGVIVITTKKGQAGPARWTASAEHGRTRMAGDYPDLLLRWGHLLDQNTPVLCRIGGMSLASLTGALRAVSGRQPGQLSALERPGADGAGPGAPHGGDASASRGGARR